MNFLIKHMRERKFRVLNRAVGDLINTIKQVKHSDADRSDLPKARYVSGPKIPLLSNYRDPRIQFGTAKSALNKVAPSQSSSVSSNKFRGVSKPNTFKPKRITFSDPPIQELSLASSFTNNNPNNA